MYMFSLYKNVRAMKDNDRPCVMTNIVYQEFRFTVVYTSYLLPTYLIHIQFMIIVFKS